MTTPPASPQEGQSVPARKPVPVRKLTVSLFLKISRSSDFKLGDWREEALCDTLIHTEPETYQPEDWFPRPRHRQPLKVKQTVINACNACTVRLECLVYALVADVPDGIWGGHTPKQIRRLNRRLKKALRERSSAKSKTPYKSPKTINRPTRN